MALLGGPNGGRRPRLFLKFKLVAKGWSLGGGAALGEGGPNHSGQLLVTGAGVSHQ